MITEKIMSLDSNNKLRVSYKSSSYVDIENTLRLSGLSINDIKSPAVIKSVPDIVQDYTIIDYYNSSEELLLALIMASMDTISNVGLSEFTEYTQADPELVERIKEFEIILKATPTGKLDFLIESHKDTLVEYKSAIERSFSFDKVRKRFDENTEKTEDLCIAKAITLVGLEVGDIAVTNYGYLCNCINGVTESELSSTSIGDSTLDIAYQNISKIGSWYFSDNQILCFGDNKELIYSYILGEYLEYHLRRVLE